MDWKLKLKEIFSQFGSIYILKDIDEILKRTSVRKYLYSENIDILYFSDPVHFRYMYERNYRFGRKNTLVITLNENEFEELPWDVYNKSFCVTMTFEHLFPTLDQLVLRSLSDDYLDVISNHYPYLEKSHKERTENFILKIIFGNKIQSVINKEDAKRILEKYWTQFDEPVPDLLFSHLKRQLTTHISLPDSLLCQFVSTEKYQSDFITKKKLDKLRLEKNFNENSFLKIAETIGSHRAQSISKSISMDEKKIKDINDNFQIWIQDAYGGLPTKSSVKHPIMVHKIPDILNRKLKKKIALIVMDGMSFSQWNLVNSYLKKNNIYSEVDASFAWIPSMTSVSRQSIFSGKTPLEFHDSIGTTNNESKKWQYYWEKQGIFKNEVIYMRSLGLNKFDIMKSQIAYPQIKVFGGVIDIIDKFMHSAHQGLKSVHLELQLWLESGYLLNFLNGLFELGYDIFITSDHGNIEAIGIGSMKEGVLAETNGKRMAVYENEILRNRSIINREDVAFKWDNYYLPKNYKTIIAKDKFAFDTEGKKIVTHGGTHIEEVIVPFARVYRSEQK